MADEPENMTLHLLREIRSELREGFTKAFDDLAELRGSVSELQFLQKVFPCKGKRIMCGA